jgi:hypothetical protein
VLLLGLRACTAACLLRHLHAEAVNTRRSASQALESFAARSPGEAKPFLEQLLSEALRFMRRVFEFVGGVPRGAAAVSDGRGVQGYARNGHIPKHHTPPHHTHTHTCE